MKNHFSMIEHVGGNRESRFIVNGVRVSRDKFESIKIRARMHGVMDCLQTKAIPVEGNTFRRINYNSARY